MISTITPLGIAALALLAERPMHPYEMYQLLIQRSDDRLVKVRPGSLYHAIERLAGQGLMRATGTEREGNRPERTTYEITERGQLALSERIAEMLATPVNEYPEFPLAIYQAHNLPKHTVIELLRRRHVRLCSEIDDIAATHKLVTEKKVDRRYWLDLTYRRAMFDAELAWVESLIADLESGAVDW
jgi:DNA-binding PadR family transcriptional regulator